MESHQTPKPFPLSAELEWEAPVSFSPTAKLQSGTTGGSESTWGHQYLTSDAEEDFTLSAGSLLSISKTIQRGGVGITKLTVVRDLIGGQQEFLNLSPLRSCPLFLFPLSSPPPSSSSAHSSTPLDEQSGTLVGRNVSTALQKDILPPQAGRASSEEDYVGLAGSMCKDAGPFIVLFCLFLTR